jgi:hypothetical protein
VPVSKGKERCGGSAGEAGRGAGGGGGSSAEPHSAAERRADVKAVYRCEMRGEKFDFSARRDEFRKMRQKQVELQPETVVGPACQGSIYRFRTSISQGLGPRAVLEVKPARLDPRAVS